MAGFPLRDQNGLTKRQARFVELGGMDKTKKQRRAERDYPKPQREVDILSPQTLEELEKVRRFISCKDEW